MKPNKQPPNLRAAMDRLGPTVESLGLKQKAFPLAPGSSISAVVVRELSSYDDDEVARGLSLSPDTSMLYAGRVMKREAMRRAIVGYWPAGGGEYVAVSQPFDGFERFNLPTMRQITEFFEILNGIDEDDLKKGAAAAVAWKPGDGAPSWPSDAASEASTGSASPRSEASEAGPE